jgi:hypothetical protein
VDRGGRGEVRVWVVRAGGAIHVAAAIPDSTFYWGDDLVVSLDVGAAETRPGRGTGSGTSGGWWTAASS